MGTKGGGKIMPIVPPYKKGGEDWIPAPQGMHIGVLVDVVPLGEQEVKWEGEVSWRDMVRLSWQIDEDMEGGPPFLVSRRFTNSLHPRAGLSRACEAMMQREFAEEERGRFDIETLLGLSCQLDVVHNYGNNGKVYANIKEVSKLGKGQVSLTPRDYVRVVDREGGNAIGQRFVDINTDTNVSLTQGPTPVPAAIASSTNPIGVPPTEDEIGDWLSKIAVDFSFNEAQVAQHLGKSIGQYLLQGGTLEQAETVLVTAWNKLARQ
jgi:hypothetical protein